jgi:hypothetical protein
MLPADDREFADVFLSVGGVWSYAQVESVSNLTAIIQSIGPEDGSSQLTIAQGTWAIPRLFSN